MRIFREGWNHHRIRTAHHHSPNQLFVEGVLELHTSGLAALDFLDQVDELYGVDPDEQLPVTNDSNPGVSVPEVSISIDVHHIHHLQQEVDPLSNNGHYGIEVFERALEILGTPSPH